MLKIISGTIDMMSLFTSLREENDLHHAYVCIGDTSATHKELEAFLVEHMALSTIGNPDYRVFEETNMTIDTARELGVLQAQKNMTGNKQVFVLKVGYIGEEAQNALLKIFEEPTSDTHFFVLLPQDTLLPTLRSRVRMLISAYTETQTFSFLSLSVPERLGYIKKMTDNIGDEKQTKQDAINLINQIEGELYADGGVSIHASALAVCEKARTALFSRGAMTKMLLEHVALSI